MHTVNLTLLSEVLIVHRNSAVLILMSQTCIQDNLRCHTVVMFAVTNSHRSVILSLPIGVSHWAGFGALFVAKFSVSKRTLPFCELIWSPLCI